MSDHRCVGAGTENAGRDRGARPREVMIDQPAHRLDLTAHGLAQGAGIAVRRVGHYREGGLERMGEIADPGPGALDDLGVMVEKGVELLDQWLHLSGIPALEPALPAGADAGEDRSEAAQRQETVNNLQDHGGEQAESERHER